MPKPKVLRPLKPAPPDTPAPFDEFIAHSIQALLTGTATAHQQQKAMEWIITQASNAHGVHYYGAATHDSAFAQGRAFVGQQLVGIARIDLVSLSQPPTKER